MNSEYEQSTKPAQENLAMPQSQLLLNQDLVKN